MWIFTRIGFVNIVQNPSRPERLLLTFRCREHAAAFHRRLFGEGAAEPEIRHTPDADYHWKFSAPAAQAADLIRALVQEIDYANFQSACKGSAEMAPTLQSIYDIWTLMVRYQRERRRRTKSPAAEP